jgi:hypothetical protein
VFRLRPDTIVGLGVIDCEGKIGGEGGGDLKLVSSTRIEILLYQTREGEIFAWNQPKANGQRRLSRSLANKQEKE